jgi:hypothetical protein
VLTWAHGSKNVARKAAYLNQNLIGIDQATINKIEAGKWAISVDMIELFLLHYGGSVKDMFVLTEIKIQQTL